MVEGAGLRVEGAGLRVQGAVASVTIGSLNSRLESRKEKRKM